MYPQCCIKITSGTDNSGDQNLVYENYGLWFNFRLKYQQSGFIPDLCMINTQI